MPNWFSQVISVTLFNLRTIPARKGAAIAAGVGIFGAIMLVYATSDVLNNPEYDNPVQGALMLFAALFNIFVSALHLLMRLFGGGRR